MAIIRLAAICVMACAVEAKVVINEISYHPPEDNDALEFIELHNSGSEEVDLSGWKFTKGIKYEFAKGDRITANGFLVLARDKDAFKSIYGTEPSGLFKSSLKNSGENLELSDARGQRVDKVQFKDEAPWPLSADGESATLERISPEADSEEAMNWASSPLSKDASKPAGTPGIRNANYSKALPPIITGVSFEPRQPNPEQPVTVSAVIRDGSGSPEGASVVYRVAKPGAQTAEEVIAMTRSENRYTATIPAQSENVVVRFRIEAIGTQGGKRLEPGANEPVPAYSYYTHEKSGPSKTATAYLIHVNENDFKKAQNQRPQRGGPRMNEEDMERFNARRIFEMRSEFSPLWGDLCLNQKLSRSQVTQLREAIRGQMDLRAKGLEEVENAEEPLQKAKELVPAFFSELARKLEPTLNDEQRKTLEAWVSANSGTTPPNMTPDLILQRLCNAEGALLYASANAELTDSSYETLKSACAETIEERKKLRASVVDAMEGRGDGQAIDDNLGKLNGNLDKKIGALLRDDESRKGLADWRENNHPFRYRPTAASSKRAIPPRGENAFVYVSKTGEAELFDFVELKARNGGYKVHFPKRRPFQEMSAINLIFEQNDRFVLAEALAYEVYRKAGNAAAKTEFMRLNVDGRPFGYHLLVEQPNRAFLKRNKIRDDGNLYKILWYEQGAERQHEKKTNERTGHEDLRALLDQLENSKGEEQWAVIKKNFNVEQVINYFAVNMVLSHWDGFFNNYFTYHNVNGTGKWEMYPWDQDKTWGFHDQMGDEVFFNMPVTYGMEGDRPPGFPKDRPPPKGFNGGHWWRPGGYFSKPLLANPHFRKLFLARTREILEDVYTEKNFFPEIDKLEEQLKDELPVRAAAQNENAEEAKNRFERDLQSLKEHLVKRREFLLAQEEIKTAGKFDAAELK